MEAILTLRDHFVAFISLWIASSLQISLELHPADIPELKRTWTLQQEVAPLGKVTRHKWTAPLPPVIPA